MAEVLSLGCYGLSKPETDLINTILRTSSFLSSSWVFVSEGHCDALITSEVDADPSPLSKSEKTQIIPVMRRGDSSADLAFLKPIRADEFIELLNTVKANVRAQSAPKPAPAARVAPSPAASPKTSTQPPPASKKASPAPASPAAPVASGGKAITDAESYRLKRWPPANVLQGDKRYIKLASYLVRTPRTRNDLANLSGFSRDVCESFLQLLLSNDLVTVETISLGNRAPQQDSQQNANKKGFFKMLRTKLGLGA